MVIVTCRCCPASLAAVHDVLADRLRLFAAWQASGPNTGIRSHTSMRDPVQNLHSGCLQPVLSRQPPFMLQNGTEPTFCAGYLQPVLSRQPPFMLHKGTEFSNILSNPNTARTFGRRRIGQQTLCWSSSPFLLSKGTKSLLSLSQMSNNCMAQES